MQFEYPPRLGWCTKHNSATACKDCEIDRLTAQLAKTEKALKDTIRVYIVDDEEWDREAKMLKIFDRIMKEVE